MNRNKCPKDLEEIRILDKGYLRYKDWGKYLEYREIWVNPKERQKKWGTKLMKQLVNITKSRGYDTIYTIVHTDGKSDILGKFITKNGFKPCKFNEFNFSKTIK